MMSARSNALKPAPQRIYATRERPGNWLSFRATVNPERQDMTILLRRDLAGLLRQIPVHHQSATRAQIRPMLHHACGDFRGMLGISELHSATLPPVRQNFRILVVDAIIDEFEVEICCQRTDGVDRVFSTSMDWLHKVRRTDIRDKATSANGCRLWPAWGSCVRRTRTRTGLAHARQSSRQRGPKADIDFW